MYFQGNWYLEKTSKHGGRCQRPAQNQSTFLGLTQRIWQRWEDYLTPALTWIWNQQNKHVLWFFTIPRKPTNMYFLSVACTQRGSMSLLQVLQHTVVKMRVADPHCVLQGTFHVDCSAIQLWSAPTGTSLELLQFQMQKKAIWATSAVSVNYAVRQSKVLLQPPGLQVEWIMIF